MTDAFDASDLDASRRIEASAKDIMNILQNFPHNDSPRRGASPRRGSSPRRGQGARTPSRTVRTRGIVVLSSSSSSSSSSSDDDSLYATAVPPKSKRHDHHPGGETKKAGSGGGFVDLDILINNAFRAMQDHVTSRTRYGAALLATAGRVFTACQTEGLNGTFVSAERVAILKAVSEGFMEFEKIVICSDQTVGFPTPDGASLQMLSAYGNFTVTVVNATRTYQEFQSQELWEDYKRKLASGRGEAQRLANQRDPHHPSASSSSVVAAAAAAAARLNESTDAFLREKFEAMKSNDGLVSADDARRFLDESRDRVRDLNNNNTLNNSMNFEQFRETVARELEHPQSSSSSSSSSHLHGSNHNNHGGAGGRSNADVFISLDIGETVQRVLDVFHRHQRSSSGSGGSSGDAGSTNLVIGKHDRRLITCFSKPGSDAIVVTGLEAGSTTFTVTNISAAEGITSRRYERQPERERHRQRGRARETVDCKLAHSHTGWLAGLPWRSS
jgi:cytidine deaminase